MALKKRRLGKTGLYVTEVGFGGIPIQRISEEEAISVVKRCYELGINYYDTARGYTTSEERIGKALEGVREIIYLAKKGDSRRLNKALLRLEGHVEDIERVIEANADRPKVQEALTALKELLEERAAENEAAIEGATNNTDDPGILERVLETYRQRYQRALGSGWRGSR